MFGVDKGVKVWSMSSKAASGGIWGKAPSPIRMNQAMNERQTSREKTPVPMPGEQAPPLYWSDIFNHVAKAGWDSLDGQSFNTHLIQSKYRKKTPAPDPTPRGDPDTTKMALEIPPQDELPLLKTIAKTTTPDDRVAWNARINALTRMLVLRSQRPLTEEENRRLVDIRADIQQGISNIPAVAAPAVLPIGAPTPGPGPGPGPGPKDDKKDDEDEGDENEGVEPEQEEEQEEEEVSEDVSEMPNPLPREDRTRIDTEVISLKNTVLKSLMKAIIAGSMEGLKQSISKDATKQDIAGLLPVMQTSYNMYPTIYDKSENFTKRVNDVMADMGVMTKYKKDWTNSKKWARAM